MPGSGHLTLTGRQGEIMQESARTTLTWLRPNASRRGLDPGFHRDTDVHLHVDSGGPPQRRRVGRRRHGRRARLGLHGASRVPPASP